MDEREGQSWVASADVRRDATPLWVLRNVHDQNSSSKEALGSGWSFLYFLAFMALGGAMLRRTRGVSWRPGGASPGSSMCTVMIWDDKWDEPLLFEVKSTQWKITNSSRQQLNCKKTPHAALLLLLLYYLDGPDGPTVIATITFRRISSGAN